MRLRKYKILLISPSYPEESGGYAGVFTQDLATLLCDGGFDTSVLCGTYGSPSSSDGRCPRIFKFSLHRVMPNPLLVGFPNPAKVLRFTRRVKPDIIHVHFADMTAILGSFVSKVERKPMVVTVMGHEICFEKSISYGLRSHIAGWVVPKIGMSIASRLVVASRYMRRVLILDFDVSKTKIHVLQPVLRKAFLEKRADHRSNRSRKIVLSVANLVPVKGLDAGLRVIADVLAQVPDAEYWIAGEGPCLRELKALAVQLKIHDHVKFLGSVRPSEMPSLYDQAWLLFMPSRHESYGQAKSEAAACARPVVARDCGGLPEQIEHGFTGYICSDHDDFVRHIAELLTRPALAKRMGLRARKASKRCRRDSYLSRICKVYGETGLWDCGQASAVADDGQKRRV